MQARPRQPLRLHHWRIEEPENGHDCRAAREPEYLQKHGQIRTRRWLQELPEWPLELFGCRYALVSHSGAARVDKTARRTTTANTLTHASAGLIYLSLFVASKFAITIPFLAPAGSDPAAFAAFPSRTRVPNIKVTGPNTYELPTRSASVPATSSMDSTLGGGHGVSRPNQTVSAVRRQAAAPPIYLLCVAVIPFFASVYIAGSRWWDFRHHAFDIIFGYLIGTVSAFFAFRYYHLPISNGAGWAWGPRSRDKAFWAGVGSFSYATDHLRGQYRSGDEEEALSPTDAFGRGSGVSGDGPGGPAVASRKGPAAVDDRDTAYPGASAI